ncbi:MAG: hypothetical protein M3Q64_01800 [bacterium]|nr:hypothetical protein [bacterium]
MIDFAEIRKEIATEHNVLLGKDDPILMLVTLNRVMFEKYIDVLVEKNTELLVALSATQEKRDAEIKARMSKMITETGDYLEERMRTGLIDATKDIIAQHKKALGAAWKEIEVARKTVIATAVVSCFCAIVTVVMILNVGA